MTKKEDLYKKLVGEALEMELEDSVLWNSGGLIMWQEDMKRLIDLVAAECLLALGELRSGADKMHHVGILESMDAIERKFEL